MANTKGSDLPHPTSMLLTDLILIVTDPAGTPASKSIALSNLIASVVGTTAGTLAAGDDARLSGVSSVLNYAGYY